MKIIPFSQEGAKLIASHRLRGMIVTRSGMPVSIDRWNDSEPFPLSVSVLTTDRGVLRNVRLTSSGMGYTEEEYADSPYDLFLIMKE